MTDMTPVQDLTIGDRVDGERRLMAPERLWMFSGGPLKIDGWPARNMHTCHDFAERIGLAAPVVSATQLQGHLCELFIDLYGMNWFSAGWMDVKFVGLVEMGETSMFDVVLTARTESDGVIEDVFDVACRNGDDDVVVVGMAGCAWPADKVAR